MDRTPSFTAPLASRKPSKHPLDCDSARDPFTSEQSRVLIVEDNDLGREQLAVLLQEDYELAFAVNGREALAKISSFCPDLVLLDVMVPSPNGFEVCEQVRANPETAETPIILLTALTDRNSRIRGLEAGADDFISKPYDHAELRARVRSITRLNRFRLLVSGRQKFEYVVHHAETGYLEVDDSDRIRFFNPRARLLLGLPSGALEGVESLDFTPWIASHFRCEPTSSWENWPHPPDPDQRRWLVRAATESSPPLWIHVETVTGGVRDGKLTWIVRLTDLSSEMRSRGMIWSFENAIRHKLRTPITVILGSLALLTDSSSTLLEVCKTELLNQALEQTRRLHEDVERVLKSVDRGRSGQGNPTPIHRLEETILYTARQLQTRVVVRLPTDHLLNHSIPLSESEFGSILWELLDNAKKFHPDLDPTVEIDLRDSTDRKVHLTLVDDGGFLSPDQIAKAWTPYYQAESSFSGRVPGMGLGLSIVATTLWGVGGFCSIVNRDPGPGVEITLSVPLVGADI